MQFVARNARFCVPTVIDKKGNLYTITCAFKSTPVISDINPTNTLQKWYKQTNKIKVTIIPFTDKHIEPGELRDESFIYHEKNQILKFVHTANQMDKTLKKQQEIIQKYNGKQFLISHLQDLTSNKEIESLINCLNHDKWKLKLAAIFIELTWDKNAFEIAMRSPQNNKNEDNVILGLFLMNNQKQHRKIHKQLFIKSTIMINRNVWLKQNNKKYPYHQLYWNTVALSKYFLNILYGVMVGHWQTNYSKNDTITVVPFVFKSNKITFIWEKIKHNNNINIKDRKYIIRYDLDAVRRSQKTKPGYKYSGIHSFDGIFNMNDTQTLMDNTFQHEIFFMLKNENNNAKQILHQLTEKEMKHEEMKMEMSQNNGNVMRTYIENNKETININISDPPPFWNVIKQKLHYFFNINKYQFGMIQSSPPNSTNSFIIPMYELRCGETNIFFQNSEMLLFIICMSKITIYTGDVCLINKPGRIFIINYNSIPHDNILINSNGNKVIILMLRTSPFVKTNPSDKMQFLDLNVEYYDQAQIKKGKKKRKYRKIKKNKNTTPKSIKQEMEQQMDEKMESSIKTEYNSHFVSQTVLECDELGQHITNKKKKKEIDREKATINTGLDLENINEQKEYFEDLLEIHEYEKFAVQITFYLGNIYEKLGEYARATDYYNTSLDLATEFDTFKSTFSVHHKYYCLRKMYNNLTNNNILNSVNELKRCTHIAVANDKLCKDIRKKWVANEVVEYELMGAATCALCLAQYYEDKIDPLKWNDDSLLYYKIAMNILEKVKLIKVQMVSIDSMIDSFNTERNILRIPKPSTKKIKRKRIDKDNEFEKYVETTENIMQNYLQCLIERFRSKDYVLKDTNELAVFNAFYEFNGNKNKYNHKFERYLQMEMDSVFEILYNYWCYERNIYISNDEMADVYNNYAAFLSDKLHDYDSALLWFEESLELNPADVVTHWNIAEMYEKLSQWETAKEYYNRALDLSCQTENEMEIKQMAIDVLESIERIDRAKNTI